MKQIKPHDKVGHHSQKPKGVPLHANKYRQRPRHRRRVRQEEANSPQEISHNAKKYVTRNCFNSKTWKTGTRQTKNPLKRGRQNRGYWEKISPTLSPSVDNFKKAFGGAKSAEKTALRSLGSFVVWTSKSDRTTELQRFGCSVRKLSCKAGKDDITHHTSRSQRWSSGKAIEKRQKWNWYARYVLKPRKRTHRRIEDRRAERSQVGRFGREKCEKPEKPVTQRRNGGKNVKKTF